LALHKNISSFNFLKTVFKYGIDYFYINLVDRLVAFFSFLLLARVFDSQVYGRIATVFAVSTIVMTIFDFGLPVYGQRESSKSDVLSETITAVSSVKIPFILAYVLIIPIVFFVFFKDVHWGLVIIISGIVLTQSIATLFAYIYFGKDNSWLVLLSNMISKMILLAIIFTSYFYFRNIYFFLSGYLFAYLFLVVTYFAKIKSYNVHIRDYIFTFDKLRSTLILIIPLGISSIFNLIYDKVDIVILSAYLDYEKVAQYSVAYTIYKLSSIVFSILLFPALNRFSRLAENFYESFKLLLKYLVIIIIVSVILIILLVFVASYLIPILFGSSYLEASGLIIPLSFATILWALNSLAGVFLNGLGKFNKVMVATLGGMIFNIICNVILIPILGIMGAVYSTIITEGIILVIEVSVIFYYYRAAGIRNV